MTNNDIQQAKEWADYHAHTELVLEGSAARVIQSLPDHWIDAEKIEKLLTVWRSQLEECDHADGHTVMITCINDLAFEIATPPLPTLADMTPEERERCQWMQAELDGEAESVVIVSLSPMKAWVMWDNGTFGLKAHDEVTPLPDLPRLEWSGSGDVPTIAEQENVAPDQQVNPQVNLDSSLPRPEDVPPGEPWIVRNEGCRDQWVGTRDDSGTTSWPWILVKIDGTDYALSQDVEVTLVSRLVPEVAP